MIESDSLRSSFEKCKDADATRHRMKWIRQWLSFGVALIATSLLGWWSIQSDSDNPAEPPQIDLSSASLSLQELVDEARDAIIQTPTSAAHWGRLGMILLANERDVEAIPCFRQAVLLAPNDFRWHYYLGLTATPLDRELAISSFAAACEVQPNDSISHARLGELLIASDDIHGAGIQLEKAIQTSRIPDPRPFQALARVRLLEDRVDEAKNFAEQAYRLAPDSRMVVEVLARIADREGDNDLAKRLLHQLRNLPDRPLPWIDPYAEQALTLRRDSFWVADKAIAMAESGNSDRAIQLLSAELKKSPDSVSIYLTLSQIYIQIQQLNDALSVLNTAMVIAPKNAEVRFRIGVVRFLRKEPGAAADSFRQALHLKPDHALAMYNLGQCCLLQSDQQGAIDAFEATLQIAPDQTPARLNLARLLIKLGQPEQARGHLDQILIAYPGNTDAEELLEQIASSSK